MRPAREVRYRGIRRHIFVHDRDRPEKFEQPHIIEALEEVGMRPVQFLVIFCQEIRILVLELPQEKMHVADGTVCLLPFRCRYVAGIHQTAGDII